VKAPLREFSELDVEETEVEVEDIISVLAKRFFELLPKTGDEIEFKLIGYPE
jgi:hypothetical protein